MSEFAGFAIKPAESAARSDPDRMVLVLSDTQCAVINDSGTVLVIVFIIGKCCGRPVHFTNTGIRRQPYIFIMINEHVIDHVAADTAWLTRIGSIINKFPG